jgi:hypothetical protein
MKTIWQQDPWCQFLPALHRQLAEPSIESGLPLDYHDLQGEQIYAWWETLRYVFHGLLGWRDLPSGLAAWYLADKPSYMDPRLQLAKERWKTLGFTGMSLAQDSALSRDFEPADGWWRQLEARQLHASQNPYQGGSNPLHLGHSDDVGLQESDGPRWSQYDAKLRTALIVVERFETWRYDLETFGKQLPPLQNRSWHVEVHDRKIGFLGTFRQSRATGIWFQGQHSVHMLGNSSLEHRDCL